MKYIKNAELFNFLQIARPKKLFQAYFYLSICSKVYGVPTRAPVSTTAYPVAAAEPACYVMKTVTVH